MTIYLYHLSTPLPRGTSPTNKSLQAGHYIGYTNDLVGRILAHGDTTWKPFEKPITLEDGRRCNGKKKGKGATFLAVCNARGIQYELVRTWDGEGATRAFERRLKNQKNAARFCPVCNPESAFNHMQMDDYES